MRTRLEIISALVGLTGAVTSHERNEYADSLLLTALQLYAVLPDEPSEGVDGAVEQTVSLIHAEKRNLAPGGSVCASPCGNTADFNLELWPLLPEEERTLKLRLVQLAGQKQSLTPDMGYKVATYFGKVRDLSLLQGLLDELNAIP